MASEQVRLPCKFSLRPDGTPKGVVIEGLPADKYSRVLHMESQDGSTEGWADVILSDEPIDEPGTESVKIATSPRPWGEVQA